MYICICNALRQRELADHAASPDVKGPACVFKLSGKKPQCGRCLPDIAEMIAPAPGAPVLPAE